MKRFTLRVCGFPAVSLDIEDLEYVDEDAPAFGGGSTHNFEMAEPFVDERFLPWEDEDKFRFGAR